MNFFKIKHQFLLINIMSYTFNYQSNFSEEVVLEVLQNFSTTGELFGNGERNKIKLFEVDGLTINVKSFKIPNLINKIVYRYFRKSKARRSFEYAKILESKEIGTPEPIMYLEKFNWLGLHDSYYVSQHLDCDLTFRELVEIPEYPNNDVILRQFTRFSFELHQKGIEFKDHSPGNTLIKQGDNKEYQFFLVDLNRMNFHDTMSFELRMKNLSRLTPKRSMVEVMSDEYAKCSGIAYDKVFTLMWHYTEAFQKKYYQKIAYKKKLKFWK